MTPLDLLRLIQAVQTNLWSRIFLKRPYLIYQQVWYGSIIIIKKTISHVRSPVHKWLTLADPHHTPRGRWTQQDAHVNPMHAEPSWGFKRHSDCDLWFVPSTLLPNLPPSFCLKLSRVFKHNLGSWSFFFHPAFDCCVLLWI
jgi:hypothetical protein